jgi:hypothetical protein
VEDFDLFWEEDAGVDIKLDDDDVDIVDNDKASSDTDDDMLPFPLTFNSSADLRWKLQKADILPAVSVLSSQRPATAGGLVRTQPVKVEVGLREKHLSRRRGWRKIIQKIKMILPQMICVCS